jgi:hypothetical protein
VVGWVSQKLRTLEAEKDITSLEEQSPIRFFNEFSQTGRSKLEVGSTSGEEYAFPIAIATFLNSR